jgi:hypothetical protein
MRTTANHSGYGIGGYYSPTLRGSQTALDVPPGYDGLFVSNDPPPFHLSVLYKHVVLTTALVVEGMDEVVLMVPPDAVETSRARIRVRVADARTGAPLHEASVSARDRASGGRRTKPDETGLVVLEDVAPGLLRFHVGARDPDREIFASHDEYVRVPAEENLDLGTIAFDFDATLDVKVVDSEGNGVAGSIWFRNLDRLSPFEPLATNHHLGTREDGTCSIHGLVPGRYAIFAAPGGALQRLGYLPGPGGPVGRVSRPAVAKVADGDIDPVTLVLESGIAVNIQFITQPERFYWVRINDERGVPVSGEGILGSSLRKLRKYTLLPGEYTLTAAQAEEPICSGRFRVGRDPVWITADLTTHGEGQMEMITGSDAAARHLQTLPASAIARSEERDTPPDDFPPGTQAEVVLVGRIHDPYGNPLEGARVGARDESKKSRKATVDGSSYAILGLTPGRWTLSVKADGFDSAQQVIDLQPAPAMQAQDLVVGPATLSVQVLLRTPEGAPLIESLFECARQDGQRELLGWKTHEIRVLASENPLPSTLAPGDSWRDYSDAGRYFDDYPVRSTGRVVLTKHLPVHVGLLFEGRVYGMRVVDAPVEEIEIVCRPDDLLRELTDREIRFRVVDSQSGEILRPDMATICSLYSYVDDVQAGPEIEADGTVVVSWMGDPGQAKIRIRVKGYEPFERLFRIPDRPLVDLGEVALDPLTEIRGVVMDPNGRPVECDLSVRSLGRGDRFQEPSWGRNIRSDDGGAFVIPAGRGQYELRVAGSSWTPTYTVVDTTEGDVSDVSIVVVRGVEVVFEWQGEKPQGVQLRVFNEAGESLLGKPASLNSGTLRVRLSQGIYTVTVDLPDGAENSIPFVVGATPMRVGLGH